MVVKGIGGLIISFSLIGLFVFAMVTFGVGLSENNANPNQTILENQVLSDSYNNLDTQFETFSNQVNASRTIFESNSGNFILNIGDLLLNGILTIGKTLTSGLAGFVSITLGLIFGTIFGGSTEANPFAIVTTLITSIIILLAILWAWRLFKQGE